MFDLAISKFDEYNASDPNKEMSGDGRLVAKELLYAQRMTDCLKQLAPEAPEEVQLAVRSQHIGRWQIPRNTFPEGRKGYLQWRSKLKDLHAEIATGILRDSGYSDEMIDKVRFLLLKKDLHHNAGTQLVEDVVCLVFLTHYLADFAKKHEAQKVVEILRKTVKKMSRAARKHAAAIPLDSSTRELLKAAL